jgi:predicted outer membrane repeat protein
MCPSCLLLGIGEDEYGHATSDLSGTYIDRYLLVEKIGEGGMGSVWRSRQSDPVEREVALKLIKPGMDTGSVLARFEAERQVLATLDHPNIAKIFDAGTTEKGLPYYVMELVDGLPVTNYCERNQLSIKERLTLFNHICRAVQHAHRQGVIHRDLKPLNILVADHGEARLKVIDFGIAKTTSSLAEETAITHQGQIIGTPEYMSPEQATGNAEIDGRSDVYSLGALLYELISGSPPFSKKRLRDAGLLEVIRTIQEEEPPPPGNQQPHSSLDWIALKALSKDPAQRYENPAALSDDIDRHFAGKSTIARAPGVTARLRKFRRDHPVAAIGSVVAIPLVAATFLLMSSWRSNSAAQISETPTVTTVADSGPGSLRDLIGRASPRSEIVFSPDMAGKTITLSGEPLTIDKYLLVIGNGVTIDGGGKSRLFNIEKDKVTLSGLTLTGGNAGEENGGAILNTGSLTLEKCRFVKNRARDGGAIQNKTGWVRVTDCYFSENVAENAGGAVYLDGIVSVAFRNCTFAQNRAHRGGAIFSQGASSYTNCTFTENRCESADGNTDSTAGGAILAMTSLYLTSTTVVDNHQEEGGGIFFEAGGHAIAYDSIIADNTATSGNIPNHPFPHFHDKGGNLLGIDPMLAPLGDYGGPVPTMPPMPGSPAVDFSPDRRDTRDGGVTKDARGRKRPIDGNGDGEAKPDAGAVEFDPSTDIKP